MSLQFPPSPGPDFQFTANNGVQYYWDGDKWVANKDLVGGGGDSGGTSGGLWLRDDATGTLYPERDGDSVSIRNGGVETIGLDSDGTVEAQTISFDDFQDLPLP